MPFIKVQIFLLHQSPLLLHSFKVRAVSSAVERLAYTELVGGSIPSLPTTPYYFEVSVSGS